MLTFPATRGAPVTITPLTLSALLDRVPGVELAQILQTAPTTLRVRLQPAARADRSHVWRTLSAEIATVLRTHGVGVTLRLDDDPPCFSPGGEYRLVQPLRCPWDSS